MKMEMKKQDMEELWQLLMVYEKTYGGIEVSELLEEVQTRYHNVTGENIFVKRNPRGAGRKRKYTEKEKQRIRDLHDEGRTIRRIAEEMGCSVGYVQGVLSDLSKRNVQ